MKNKYLIFFPFAFFCFFIACKKTPPENKLAGKWKIEKAFVNGTDKTSELDTLHILYYEFTRLEDYDPCPPAAFVKLVVDTSKIHWEDTCRLSHTSGMPWHTVAFSINDEENKIYFGKSDCTSGKSFIPMFIDSNVEYWNIIKWKSGNFWVQCFYNGKIHETRLKKIK